MTTAVVSGVALAAALPLSPTRKRSTDDGTCPSWMPARGCTVSAVTSTPKPRPWRCLCCTRWPHRNRRAPAAKSEPDPRSPGQRVHDAFKTVLQLALRAGTLPRSGGVPATVLITMTAEQFETKTGLASTSCGQKMTVSQALRVAGEASIAWVVHNSKGGILNYGRTR